MSNTSEYIESYFQQTLSSEERVTFEKRIQTDETFAKEVAFYVATRQALHEELLKQKTASWKDEKLQEETAPIVSMAKKSILSKWFTYAAAACLFLVLSVYLFEAKTSPRRLAASYVKTNFSSLSQTMDASRDSLQLGIAAYNNKNYNRALQLFNGVEKNDSANSDAKKYAGLVYLQQQKYDKAIQQFDALANMKLFSNPGDFLKAVSLLQRNKPGDKKEAKQLLQKVVNEKEEGFDEAGKLLKKF